MHRSSLRLPAVAVATAAFLSACTSGSPTASPASSSTPSSTASPTPSQVAAAPGDTATAYPVPATATPTALPDLGTQQAGSWTITLNSVHRVSPHVVLVTATLTTSITVVIFHGFTEDGYGSRANPPYGVMDTEEFSAVTLTSGQDTTAYEPLRDSAGICACTWGFSSGVLQPGETKSVYVYLSAPAAARTVTVSVAGFAPFVDVSLT